MTADEIIDAVLVREGGWRDAVQRPDGSWDPATNKGITLPTLAAWWKQLGMTRAPSEANLRNLLTVTAREIYVSEYIAKPGFTTANIPFEPLRVQLIDFGVNSGPETAIRWLQRVITDLDVDGVLGPKTIAEIRALSFTGNQRYLRWINDALVAARSYMIDRLEDTGKLRKADEEGVESRALSFFLAKP